MCLLVHTYFLFGKSKISDSDMTIRVKKNIFRLEISVDYSIYMKTSKGINDLSSINFGPGFIKLLFFSQISKKLTAIQKIYDEV